MGFFAKTTLNEDKAQGQKPTSDGLAPTLSRAQVHDLERLSIYDHRLPFKVL